MQQIRNGMLVWICKLYNLRNQIVVCKFEFAIMNNYL